MPPPDTIYIPTETGQLPPELLEAMKETEGVIYQTVPVKQQRETDNSGAIFKGIMFFLAIGFYLFFVDDWLKRLPEIIRSKWRQKKTQKVIDSRGDRYHEWLTTYNPYYKSLLVDEQRRFLERTIHFADSKEFRFHSMVEEEYIPVLISGAAVQLTFGLKNYLMDFFHIIHVMRKEYVLNIDKETYYGHVSENGIHISWIHFMEGYKDYGDSVNLGLHEMAHALQFDAYLGYENEHDRKFKDRLNDFSAEGRPVFRAMRAGYSLLFDDYAMTNFDEFWAVSVENFFENPMLFKERLPKLYQEISELLNQDPLLPNKVIDPDLL